MPFVPVGAGVFVDLPLELTAVAEVVSRLAAALAEYAVAAQTAHGDPRTIAWVAGFHWRALLSRLWEEDKIELWGRRRTPRAKLALIDIPPRERGLLRWRAEMPVGVFFHDASDEKFFDVHLRVKAALVPAIAAPAAPTPARQRKGKIDALAELLCEVGRRKQQCGSENWEPKDFRANVDRADERVTKAAESTFYEACKRARRQLRREWGLPEE
jgi:hypothetical protein